jgi:uracil-DNA glycosylase family 4
MRCPQCKKYELVKPAGPEHADILIIGPYPGEVEMEKLMPWVGPAGQALEAELFLNDIVLDECRRTNVWQHPKDKDCELSYHYNRLVPELTRHKFLLMLGADTAKILLERKISDLSSLQLRLKSYNLPPNIVAAMAVVNPADATLGSVGELRLGIQRFAEMIRRKGYGSKS